MNLFGEHEHIQKIRVTAMNQNPHHLQKESSGFRTQTTLNHLNEWHLLRSKGSREASAAGRVKPSRVSLPNTSKTRSYKVTTSVYRLTQLKQTVDQKTGKQGSIYLFKLSVNWENHMND